MANWITFWFDHRRQANAEELAETLVQTFLHGLLLPENPVRKDEAFTPPFLCGIEILHTIPAIPVCRSQSRQRAGQAGMAGASNGVNLVLR
jgi:hypothetical protein